MKQFSRSSLVMRSPCLSSAHWKTRNTNSKRTNGLSNIAAVWKAKGQKQPSCQAGGQRTKAAELSSGRSAVGESRLVVQRSHSQSRLTLASLRVST